MIDWLADDARWLDSVLADVEKDGELNPRKDALWEQSAEGQAALQRMNREIVEGLKQSSVRQPDWEEA